MTVTAPHHTSLVLPATAPFDFGHSLRFVRGFPPMAGEQSTDGDVLTSVVREAGQVLVVRVREDGAGDGVRCDLESAQPITDEARAAVAHRCTAHLGLEDDLTEFYALGRQDEAFRPVVERLYGYHQVRFPSPFELLCWAILCQRIPMPVARSMKQRLMAEFDNSALVDGRPLPAFPDLDQLLTLSEARFAELIGNARKASYLFGAVRRWAELDDSTLQTDDYDAVRDRLLSIPGIGPWSATFLLIRGLGRTERMYPDKEALRAAAAVYRRAVGEEEFTELAARYGRWQGYWGHYLRVTA